MSLYDVFDGFSTYYSLFAHFSKGASIYDVCTEGGEGVQKSADFADKQSIKCG